jgi:SH3-like domain-containing protein
MSSGAIAALLLSLLAAAFPVAAAEEGAAKLPRFASLRSDDVNLRVGPGENYPIEWVYKRKDLPVEILRQFQNWRQVRDWQGTEGWVYERMLGSRRAVIVTGATRALHEAPAANSAVVARAEPGVVARLLQCRGAWCRIAADGHSGWVARGQIWGVFPDETVR